MADPTRIRRGIYALAAALVVGLAALRLAEVDRTLVGILAAAAGLLVAMLLITYRAFAGVAEAARAAAPPPPAADDKRED